MMHLSELAIDRFLAGEHADVDAVTAHVDQCSRCSDALADARSTRDAFPSFAPVRPLKKWLVAAPMLVAAAAIAIVITRPPHHEAVRLKGGPSFGFYVNHGGQVRRAAANREHVTANDSIEFTTTTPGPMWFAVVSADVGSTHQLIYVPARRVDGIDQTISLATQLDGTDETITGIFCHEPFDPLAPPNDCTTEAVLVTK
ncbi:MAG: hypothetical protein QM831_34185 [Kofleriaceae bacterium]